MTVDEFVMSEWSKQGKLPTIQETWAEATKQERERTKRMLKERIANYEHNEKYPAYGLNSRVAECESILGQLEARDS